MSKTGTILRVMDSRVCTGIGELGKLTMGFTLIAMLLEADVVI